ncbi:hypothetical protein [Actinomadura flavalba]|uniref:hypothetical protein n=1 Tax=Actinomadura flavalba TaxID=1120938 RepID=UPI000365C7EA|nr:hypothetical protein [Actinomadura flavalba]
MPAPDPSDRRALHSLLRAAAVPDDLYFIEGEHEPSPLPVDFVYLRRSPSSPGLWETGIYERGEWRADPPHPTEPSACNRLLALALPHRE